MRDEKDNREETEYKRQAGTSTTPSRRRKKRVRKLPFIILLILIIFIIIIAYIVHGYNSGVSMLKNMLKTLKYINLTVQ